MSTPPSREEPKSLEDSFKPMDMDGFIKKQKTETNFHQLENWPSHQKLFNLLHDLGLIATQDDMQNIIDVVKKEYFSAVEEVDKWIGAETPPENTQLVYALEKGKHPCLCIYTKGHEIVVEDFDDNREYDEYEAEKGECYLKPGWYELCEQHSGDYDEIYIKREISHWQPLPSAPKQDKQK